MMKVLYVGHDFFGYYKYIINEIERQFEANVDFYKINPKTFFYRTIKFNKKFQKLYLRNYFNTIINATKGYNYDIILMIGSYGYHLELVKILKKNHPKARFIMYQWDALGTNKYEELIPYFDRVYSFDRQDCNNDKRLIYLPLFYINEFEKRNNNPPKYDLLFVGSGDTERIKICKIIKRDAERKGKNFYCYMYFPFLRFLRMKFFDKDLKKISVKFKDVKFKRLTQNDIVDLVQSAKGVLDVERFGQSGLTMRTFETIGAKKVLFTTNKNVIYEDFFDERFIQVVDRNSVLINWKLLENKKVKYKNVVNYSLNSWIKKLLTLN